MPHGAAKGALTKRDNTGPVIVAMAGWGVATSVGRRFSRKKPVSVGSGRERSRVAILARAGARLGVAGLVLFGAIGELKNANAEGDTRTLTFHHVHTGEDITVTFKRNGRYDEAALKKLDWFMRDWRKEKDTRMDPHLYDILWQVYRDVDATKPIEIICGYRSPQTNSMLRARSNGVARESEHIQGKAIDFFIPGVPLATIREIGLKLQRGGVGFYPRSGSPFVHLDTGTVRHWPGISREELAKIFPNGRTVHIPSDGKPMRNYALALADIERRGNAPNARSLQAAHTAGVITAREVQTAGRPTLLATLFNNNRDEDLAVEDDQPAARADRKPTRIASLSPAKPVETRRIVPMPTPRPRTFALASLASRPAKPPAPKAQVAASNLFDARGMWGQAVELGAPQPPAKTSPIELAAADPVATGSTDGDALAYAGAPAQKPAPAAMPAAHARPMGARLPQLIASAHASTAPANTSLMPKASLDAASMAIGGQHWGSPWLRAAMLTPSVSGYLTLSRMDKPDPRWMRELLYRPARAVQISFAADPSFGMETSRFSGNAVVFLDTTTFAPAQTASLQ